ncbi:MAG: glycogen debranching enzyme N-terminal domain-containing protein [Pirellulales bacterium]|nr:glycogen debranching enzyme N-terminal domain-containing protein [Pirellulales bacterium]
MRQAAGPPPLRRIAWSRERAGDAGSREWLVTNGLGGYASGTLCGAPSRRYHALLVAALPAPLGRFVMFNHLAEDLRLPDRTGVRLDAGFGHEVQHRWPDPLKTFVLEDGLPVWTYELGGWVLEKRILLPHHQNTVYIRYHLLRSDTSLRLRLAPAFHFRPHEGALDHTSVPRYRLSADGDLIELHSPLTPPLRMHLLAERGSLVLDGGHERSVQYPEERRRGYEHRDRLYCPGYFRADLEQGQTVVLRASTEPWDRQDEIGPDDTWRAESQRREALLEQAHPAARQGLARELVLAADQFLILPTTRVADAAYAAAAGDEIRTVIAGYHWFTDWGRDTMISLEGLTLATGRVHEAGCILRTFARYVHDGLIPNLFPEGQREGLYNTADASLWFVHALARYLRASRERRTLQQLLPVLLEIVESYRQGTRFGIHVDPVDGLLTQGQDGYALTWMDAKVADWVVTPRRGKTVELNALWYNALCLCEAWIREAGDHATADDLRGRADQAVASFQRRFWDPDRRCLYDLVDGEDGDDPTVRPNQIFALSLDHPVLAREHWEPVIECVTAQLLTPFGLRSLAPGHPDYKATYDGDLRARDAAYHQGTVWTWPLGHFVDAWLRVYPQRRAEARRFLQALDDHLNEACVGSISEIFDAESPFAPRGCCAQAWSVAEVLRSWINTA